MCIYRFVRETLTVRDSCTVMEKTLTPNLTELLKEWGDDCISATPRSPREIDSEFTKKKYMAVWTFTVPAKKCFALDFFIRTRGLLDHTDKLTILDGDLILPVVLMSGRHEHLLPLRNDTSTVSVVYFYTSLSRNVYWRMAPSLRTSDCKKCWYNDSCDHSTTCDVASWFYTVTSVHINCAVTVRNINHYAKHWLFYLFISHWCFLMSSIMVVVYIFTICVCVYVSHPVLFMYELHSQYYKYKCMYMLMDWQLT